MFCLFETMKHFCSVSSKALSIYCVSKRIQLGVSWDDAADTQGSPFYHPKPSPLLLLDLTAAFDTVDHTILLEGLHTTVGLSDSALKWFQLSLTSRTQCVSLGSCRSRLLPVFCGVPQGSVLGPILFIIYMREHLCCVISKRDVLSLLC